jgi:hypothetical protein
MIDIIICTIIVTIVYLALDQLLTILWREDD